jgi:hypothetical protein
MCGGRGLLISCWLAGVSMAPPDVELLKNHFLEAYVQEQIKTIPVTINGGAPTTALDIEV